jgi:hypothetical protein
MSTDSGERSPRSPAGGMSGNGVEERDFGYVPELAMPVKEGAGSERGKGRWAGARSALKRRSMMTVREVRWEDGRTAWAWFIAASMEDASAERTIEKVLLGRREWTMDMMGLGELQEMDGGSIEEVGELMFTNCMHAERSLSWFLFGTKLFVVYGIVGHLVL